MSDKYDAEPKSFRISPRGMINFARNERQALAFEEGKGRLLEVNVEKDGVRITPAEKPGPNTVKASPRGLFQLPSEVHKFLTGGKKGRYSLISRKKTAGAKAARALYIGRA